MAVREIREFLAEFGLVTVALGFVIGSASASLITSLVNDIIMPSLTFFLPGEWEQATLAIGPITLRWGLFTSELLKFAIIVLGVFIIVKKVLRYSRPLKK